MPRFHITVACSDGVLKMPCQNVLLMCDVIIGMVTDILVVMPSCHASF